VFVLQISTGTDTLALLAHRDKFGVLKLTAVVVLQINFGTVSLVLLVMAVDLGTVR
jgi:hypothetical protein